MMTVGTGRNRRDTVEEAKSKFHWSQTMAMTREERQKRKLEREEVDRRIKEGQAKTRLVVATGVCPLCGGKLKRNLSMSGWWQCEQLGAEGFRKDATKPSCSWQGFTE